VCAHLDALRVATAQIADQRQAAYGIHHDRIEGTSLCAKPAPITARRLHADPSRGGVTLDRLLRAGLRAEEAGALAAYLDLETLNLVTQDLKPCQGGLNPAFMREGAVQ
jgi:hypothetical protein